MERITDDVFKANASHEWEWMHNNGIEYRVYMTAKEVARFEIWWAEECERRRIEEKKERIKEIKLTLIILAVMILLIWGLLAAIADACGVGVGSVLFALLFFPAILAAAKG